VLLYREPNSSSWTTTFRTVLNRAQARGNRVTNARIGKSESGQTFLVAMDSQWIPLKRFLL
jgi:hypothetical protein